MKIKKWFSFLEMLIVIMIVSVLFVAFRSSFEIKNKDILYGQACIETVYGQVNNFLHAGLSSKSLFTWATPIFPDQYIISFNPWSGLITLAYKKQGTTSTYSSIEFTGNNNIMYCSSNAYTIRLTWETYQLLINKWLQENESLQFFYLSGTSTVSTGWSIFLQCSNQGTWCKTMARFEADTRTIGLKKQMCLSFSTTGDCLEWDN
jgi:hypothetical protein